MSTTLTPSTTPEQPAPPPGRMTWEEFLAWADEDVRAEWVDGEIVLMSPSSVDHVRLTAFLYRVIVAYVEAHQLGEVLLPPFLMRLPTRPSGREPDLLFLAAAHADRLSATYIDGPADLVVEIVSPDSASRDRGDKFVEYEGGGIPEYGLIDPLRHEASFYELGADGRYHLGAIDADGIYRSMVLPGFWLRVAWLWQQPLPSVVQVTAEIAAETAS